ncbi:hypothetical protein DFS33DRAFT_1372595 [Desarmillaria ectypa]|nr:hypothetical protein DFS33DRAFT_1372595 [Desarmillaria ectypa]
MTLRLCPYEEGITSVLGWFQEKAPLLGPDGNLTLEVELCPRTTLHRVVKHAREKAYHDYSASYGLSTGSVESRVLREISDSLIKAGIEVTLYHPEGAPGQYEIVTSPLLPLEAVDALIHTRETIINVAVKHGLKATFALCVYMSSLGSAAHTHISSSFMVGVLKHLPAMMAVTLPTPASYKRVMNGVASGGTFVCWGTENCEAAARVTELRFLDGTCNPHLMLALILASGTAAILNHEELTVKDCPGPRNAAQLTRENFASSAIVDKTFGRELKVKYLSVNKVRSAFVFQVLAGIIFF